MVLGAIWCREDRIAEANEMIRKIKEKHGIARHAEVKWTKVSPAKEDLYYDLVDYFANDSDLHFRVVAALDKEKLRHGDFGQDHDTWYYKMYFQMLRMIFDPKHTFSVYLDIKDTAGAKKVERLLEVLNNSHYDFRREIIRKMQLVRSHEIELLQLADILIGAVMYANRGRYEGYTFTSATKKRIVEFLRDRTDYTLTKSTLPSERKFNIFIWTPQEDG